MATATIRGLPELKREMSRLSDAVATRLARNSANGGARVVAAAARKLVLVDTGRLKGSIKARKDPARRGRAGEVRKREIEDRASICELAWTSR